ncbi:ATP-binding cassette domain-containing protein [Amycolatopsis sp. CA-230715]|uniref:ATP-binding cassette domain-containing protein n=1 Tax=Amycolatopsis sp. CA-230715 TaxID=2745196 RepID=UPI001C033E4E|nr:ATP-binding cassette domain-containing protein [Amycolatopsis sp. CA-230715]QWF84696.1 Daunorubicin/doxorubicin resistance ATP-binding protein DrrA [Amycolatopsis sp. CA-230715]
MGNDLAVLVEGVAKRFGDTEALAGLDLEVPAGTICGVLGPNGAGKTTAVRILSTLLRPDRGRAFVDGIDVVRDAERARYRLGLAGQFAAVDEKLTGRGNLRMFGRLYHLPGRVAKERADELLDRFHLTEAGNRVVSTYSGGMRRRLDLAASLLIAPAVLFLDEPTTGLDPRGRAEVWAAVRDLVEGGTTVVLTTQYLDEADHLADSIAVIDAGRVVATGTPEQLKNKVGAEHVAVALASADDLAEAGAALHRATGGEPMLHPGSRTATVAVNGDPGALAAVVRELDSAGIRIDTMALRSPTLDDVFLELTGHSADEATQEVPA